MLKSLLARAGEIKSWDIHAGRWNRCYERALFIFQRHCTNWQSCRHTSPSTIFPPRFQSMRDLPTHRRSSKIVSYTRVLTVPDPCPDMLWIIGVFHAVLNGSNNLSSKGYAKSFTSPRALPERTVWRQIMPSHFSATRQMTTPYRTLPLFSSTLNPDSPRLIPPGTGALHTTFIAACESQLNVIAPFSIPVVNAILYPQSEVFCREESSAVSI